MRVLPLEPLGPRRGCHSLSLRVDADRSVLRSDRSAGDHSGPSAYSAFGTRSEQRAVVEQTSVAIGYSAAFGGAPHGRLEAAAWLGTKLSGIGGCESMNAGRLGSRPASDRDRDSGTVTWHS